MFFQQTWKSYVRPKCAMNVWHTFSLLFHPLVSSFSFAPSLLFYCFFSFYFTWFSIPFHLSRFISQNDKEEKWIRCEKEAKNKTQNVRDVPIKYLLTSSHWITTKELYDQLLMWSIFILSKNSIGHLKQQHQAKSNGKKVPAIKSNEKYMLMFDNTIWLLLCVCVQRKLLVMVIYAVTQWKVEEEEKKIEKHASG